MSPSLSPPTTQNSQPALGVFGGSFNPPHVGHLAVAEAAREQAGLDRVLWVPAATSPFKQGEPMPAAEHRLAMTRLATAGNAAFEVSEVEVRRGGVSYTVDTLRALAAERPDTQWRLVIGGDSLADFVRWHEPEAVAALAPPVVYRRPGDRVDLDALPRWLSDAVTLIEAPALDVSSTAVRALLRAGRSARYLVPDAVLRYASEHGLYAGA